MAGVKGGMFANLPRTLARCRELRGKSQAELAEIANLLSDGGVSAEICRHLAEVCPGCGERLAEVEALMKRFRHWDAETVLREGASRGRAA